MTESKKKGGWFRWYTGLMAIVALGLTLYFNTVPPGDYDLVAEKVILEPAIPVVGESVQFAFEYRNAGDDSLHWRHAEFALFVADEQVFDGNLHSGKSGSEKPIRMGFTSEANLWIPEKPGSYRIRFVVDPRDRITERAEGNNTAELVVEVP